MKRIGLDLCSLSGERATRGIGIYALWLTRALLEQVRANYAPDLDFYLFSFLLRHELENLLGPLPSNVKTVQVWGGKGRLQTLLGHQLGLAFLAARYRLAVLHSPGYGVDPSQPGLPTLLPAIRRLTTVHDLIPLHYPEIFLKAQRKRWWYKLMLGRVARSAYLLTNSEHTRQDVINCLQVDPTKIKCTPFAANQFAQLIPNLPSSCPPQPFMLVVSGPQPHKNLARLLQAYVNWQNQAAKNEVVPLVITGAAGSQAALVKVLPIQLQPYVHWFNKLQNEEMAGLYQKAKFLVFPSFYEGFGLPVLEAMTLGCPVLCSQSAALPEIGGDAVCYVNPFDITDLEKKLAQMWEDEELRLKLKEAGYTQAKKFSWQRTAEMTLEIYQKI